MIMGPARRWIKNTNHVKPDVNEKKKIIGDDSDHLQWVYE